jgi:hypothetical protein
VFQGSEMCGVVRNPLDIAFVAGCNDRGSGRGRDRNAEILAGEAGAVEHRNIGLQLPTNNPPIKHEQNNPQPRGGKKRGRGGAS